MTEDLDPERLRRLLDATARLPRTIEPPRDAWTAIRRRIDAQRVRPIGHRASRMWWFAAAAVLLVIVSSGLTVLLLRGRGPVAVAVTAPTPVPPPESVSAPVSGSAAVPGPVSQPVRQASSAPVDPVFSRYDAAAADLVAELQRRRNLLDPRTAAVLDTCLTRIDAAIAEARTALRRDPRNAVVTELLTATYQQKLDLLKRAANLPLGSH
jgi:hypothetical protein